MSTSFQCQNPPSLWTALLSWPPMANGFQLPSAPRCIWAHGKASGHLKGLQGPDVQSHVSIKVGDNKHWPWVTQCGPNCSHHWVLTLFVEEKTVYLYSQAPVHHNLRSLCQQVSDFYKLHISYSLALYLATTAFMVNAVFTELQLWFIVAPQTIFRRTTPLLDNQDCHKFVPNKYRIPGILKVGNGSKAKLV